MVYSSRKIFTGLLSDVWHKDKIVYVENLFFTISFVLFSGLSVYMTRLLLDYLAKPEATVQGFIPLVLIYFIGTGGFGFLASYFQHSAYARLSYLRLEQARLVLEKVHDVDYYHTEDTNFQSKLDHAMSAFSNNNSGFEGILQALYEFVPHMVLTVIFLVYLSTIHILIPFVIPLNAMALFLLKKKASDIYYESQDERNELRHQKYAIEQVSQDAAFGKDLRMYSLVGLMRGEINRRLDLLLTVIKRERHRSNRYLLLGTVTIFLSEAAIYFLLVRHFLNDGDLAGLVMVFSLLTRLNHSLDSIQRYVTIFFNNMPIIRDYLSFLDTDYGHTERRGEHFTESPEIEFRNVSFAYPGSDQEVLKDVSFTLHSGEKIGIVGTNGAGKTTLIKLMLSFYPLTKGEILIDGRPVQDFASGDLYDLFNVVFQENILYGFSVEENIAMVDQAIDEERVLQALEDVGMKDQVLALNHGLKQPVLKVLDEEGVEFSGGEKQKLCLARALYKGGEVMILDEPTSALDALNEAKVYENYQQMVAGKTAVFVSHRLASTGFCDRILFFAEGRLLEAGTHEELMALEGRYYEMFRIQSKYYRDEEDIDVSCVEAFLGA